MSRVSHQLWISLKLTRNICHDVQSDDCIMEADARCFLIKLMLYTGTDLVVCHRIVKFTFSLTYSLARLFNFLINFFLFLVGYLCITRCSAQQLFWNVWSSTEIGHFQGCQDKGWSYTAAFCCVWGKFWDLSTTDTTWVFCRSSRYG